MVGGRASSFERCTLLAVPEGLGFPDAPLQERRRQRLRRLRRVIRGVLSHLPIYERIPCSVVLCAGSKTPHQKTPSKRLCPPRPHPTCLPRQHEDQGNESS